MTVQWLGAPVLRTTQRRAPVLREPPGRYTFELVRILPDCRELVAWSEGPVVLTQAQADAKWAQTIPRITGVGAHPGEGLQLRARRGGAVVRSKVFVSPPPGCRLQLPSSTLDGGTLGQTGCQAPPCPDGTIKSYDPSCITGTVRCAPGALDPCPASDVVFSSRAGRCVPITCPQGTARNERDECQVAGAAAPVDYCVVPPLPAAVPSQIADRFRVCWSGQCNSGELSILLSNLNSIAGKFENTQPAITAQILRARDALVAGGASLCPSAPPTGLPPPAAGECWDAQEIAGAQPCFYFNEAGNYIGPPELVQNVDLAALRSFCLQMYFAGYFDMPICDIAAVPAPPSCISPEVRRTLRYCRDVGWQGDDRAANYFCWYALKAPAELAEWEGTPDCPPDQVPIDEDQPPATETPATPGVCNPGFAFDAATNLCVEISKPAPTAEKSSAVVPLLIGAAVVGAAVYFLS